MVEIFKGELKSEFSNRKVSCRIRHSDIKEGLLILNKGFWYILNNIEKGAEFPGYTKYGYKYSYEISDVHSGNNIIRYPDLNLVFLNDTKIYELWC